MPDYGHNTAGQRTAFTGDAGTYLKTFYDGWRVIQERDGNNAPTTSYTICGYEMRYQSSEILDVFTGMLDEHHLEIYKDYSYETTEGGNALCGPDMSGAWLTHNYYHADGNRNITCLISANQSVVASYRYDPYGNIIGQSGVLADANLYRFSSKEFHPNSGLVYYLFRHYEPHLQRWINRDPSEENAPSQNVYEFLKNEPPNRVDFWGLDDVPTPGDTRYGDCTKQQHNQLHEAIGRLCKGSGRMKCEKTDTCETLKSKIAKFKACIKAREDYNDTCWRGESAIENNEIRNARKGLDNCNNLSCEKNCK